MRKLLISSLVPVLLFAATPFVSGQPAPTGTSPMPGTAQPGTPMVGGPKQPKADEAPAKSKLEQMLELALLNNPDLRVADAKARAADAELQRMRLTVSQKVVLLYNNLEGTRATVQLQEKQLARLRQLQQGGAVPESEVTEIEAKLILAKTDLAKLESELQYLLGQPNLKGRADVEKLWQEHFGVKTAEQKDVYAKWLKSLEQHEKDDAAKATTRAAIAFLAQQQGLNSAATVNHSMTEKLRAALEKTIEFKQENLSVRDLFSNLQDSGQFEIPLIFKDQSGDVTPASISFKSVSLGALLQWVEDEVPEHRFVVRDYGLVLMKRDSVPPGALLLDDFRKEMTKAKEEKK
jgi:hypothetical protein